MKLSKPTFVAIYPSLPNQQTLAPVDEVQLVWRQLLEHAVDEYDGTSFVADAAQQTGWNGIVFQPQTTDLGVVVDEILLHNPTLIGISALSFHVPSVYILAEAIKNRKSDVKIIVGGYHATFMPEDFTTLESVDFVYRGAELESFKRFLRDYEKECKTRTSGNPANKIVNPLWTRADRLDLDTVSSQRPSDRKILLSEYQAQDFGIWPKGGFAYLKESSGCPMQCSFCEVPRYLGSEVKIRSIHLVLDEIQSLYQKGIRTIFFEGENFYGKWAIDLVKALEKLEIDMHFGAEIMAAALTPEYIVQLAAGKFVKVAIGIESPVGSDRAYLNKPGAVKVDFDQAFRTLREHGILGFGFRMTGLPSYTNNELWRNEMLVRHAPYDELRLTIFTPMPGTQLGDTWDHTTMPVSSDWGLFDSTRLVYKH